MNEKIYKTTLAARVMPELKEAILEEASEKDLTASNYMETILLDRNKGFHNDTDLYNQVELLRKENADLQEELDAISEEDYEEEEDSEEIDNLNSIIVDLEASNERLKNQIDDLKLERVTLSDQLSELNVTSLSFSENEHQELLELTQKLSEYYPYLTTNQLVLGGLNTALENQTSVFWFATIAEYKAQLTAREKEALIAE